MNRKKMTLFNYVNGVFLLLLVIVCILPILHVIALSLSERIEAVAGNVTFYPIGFTLEAYRYVMEDSQFWTSLRVTLTRVLIGVPANILLVVMTAYPLSKANSASTPAPSSPGCSSSPCCSAAAPSPPTSLSASWV